jgi:hypothetical protein
MSLCIPASVYILILFPFLDGGLWGLHQLPLLTLQFQLWMSPSSREPPHLQGRLDVPCLLPLPQLQPPNPVSELSLFKTTCLRAGTRSKLFLVMFQSHTGAEVPTREMSLEVNTTQQICPIPSEASWAWPAQRDSQVTKDHCPHSFGTNRQLLYF